MGAQSRQSSDEPMKFEAPAGDSDALHRLQRRRRANRDCARRVRKRNTQQSDALEAQVIACLVTYYSAWPHLSPVSLQPPANVMATFASAMPLLLQ